MVRRIAIVLFFMAAVGARHAVPLQGLAYAGQLQENGQPCPPECTIDSMEIITWYPSPYNSYEELYSMRLGVGNVDNEAALRPKTEGSIKVERSVIFKPVAEDPVPETDFYGQYTNVETGEMIYNGSEDKFKYFNGQTWVPQTGSGGKAIIQTFCPWRYDYRDPTSGIGFADGWGKDFSGAGSYPCDPPVCPAGFDNLGIIGSESLSVACSGDSSPDSGYCGWGSPSTDGRPVSVGRVVRACREQ